MKNKKIIIDGTLPDLEFIIKGVLINLSYLKDGICKQWEIRSVGLIDGDKFYFFAFSLLHSKTKNSTISCCVDFIHLFGIKNEYGFYTQEKIEKQVPGTYEVVNFEFIRDDSVDVYELIERAFRKNYINSLNH